MFSYIEFVAQFLKPTAIEFCFVGVYLCLVSPHLHRIIIVKPVIVLYAPLFSNPKIKNFLLRSPFVCVFKMDAPLLQIHRFYTI